MSRKNRPSNVTQEDAAEFRRLVGGVAAGSAATALITVPTLTFLAYKAPIRLGSGPKIFGGLVTGFLVTGIIQDVLYGRRIQKAIDIATKYQEILD